MNGSTVARLSGIIFAMRTYQARQPHRRGSARRSGYCYLDRRVTRDLCIVRDDRADYLSFRATIASFSPQTQHIGRLPDQALTELRNHS